MNEILFRRTDVGVTVQFVVAAALLGLALWRSWSRADLRLLVTGIGIATFAVMALRAAH